MEKDQKQKIDKIDKIVKSWQHVVDLATRGLDWDRQKKINLALILESSNNAWNDMDMDMSVESIENIVKYLESSIIFNITGIQPTLAPATKVFYLQFQNQDDSMANFRMESDVVTAVTRIVNKDEVEDRIRLFDSTILNNLVEESGNIQTFQESDNNDLIFSKILIQSLEISTESRRGSASYVICNPKYKSLFDGQVHHFDMFYTDILDEGFILGYNGITQYDGGFILSPFQWELERKSSKIKESKEHLYMNYVFSTEIPDEDMVEHTQRYIRYGICYPNINTHMRFLHNEVGEFFTKKKD